MTLKGKISCHVKNFYVACVFVVLAMTQRKYLINYNLFSNYQFASNLQIKMILDVFDV